MKSIRYWLETLVVSTRNSIGAKVSVIRMHIFVSDHWIRLVNPRDKVIVVSERIIVQQPTEFPSALELSVFVLAVRGWLLTSSIVFIVAYVLELWRRMVHLYWGLRRGTGVRVKKSVGLLSFGLYRKVVIERLVIVLLEVEPYTLLLIVWGLVAIASPEHISLDVCKKVIVNFNRKNAYKSLI